MRAKPLPSVLLTVGLTLAALPAAAQTVRVPQDVRDLQGAFSRVRDGGVIELAAGTYLPPARGFELSGPDVRKSFTVRPAPGAAAGSVVLDGQGSRAILRVQTANRTGKTATFQGLVFRHGASTTVGLGGAVTVTRADVRFVACSFLDNTANGPSTGGGAARALDGATVLFRDTTFARNSSLRRGGAVEVVGAAVTVEGGLFADNRVNLPGHEGGSTGGAIYVLDGRLDVTGARFERNQAGYAGGAILVHGLWRDPLATPSATATITASTFVANANQPDPGSPPPGQTSGGAIHVEDQATLRVLRSLFVKNVAEFGGAVDTYRGEVDVQGSAFLGNHAPDGPVVGAGGALLAISVDFDDGSTEGGLINRRPASLTVADTLLRGRFEEVGAAAQNGGCLFAAGDGNRLYGADGVPQMGTPADNRARVVLRNVVFADCDAQATADGRGGSGGGGFLDAVDLTLDGGLFLDSDARGPDAGGGALLVRRESLVRVDGTTFARNSADRNGGALVLSGSTIQIAGAQFLGNEVSPGVAEPARESRGAALQSRPQIAGDNGPDRPIDGTVAGSLFSDSAGLDLFDLEPAGGPANDLRYDGNRFFPRTFGSLVYANTLSERDGADVFRLNSLVIFRPGLPAFPKSVVPNTRLTSAPAAGALLAVPPAGAGAPGGVFPAALAYAWSGRAATLDGQPLAARAGLVPGAAFGEHRLVADGVQVASARVAPASCTAGPLLCLGDDRFRLEVQWKSGGQSGAGQAVALTRDTGTFWFFDPANLELVVKVIDGRALNGRFWVFFGALTDREYTLKVTDTRTGRVKTYRNPAGRIASVADTNAFPDTPAASSSAGSPSEAVSTADFDAAPEAAGEIAPAALAPRAACSPGPAQLCFDNGRIRATLAWSANGQNGAGQAVQLTADTGYFTFFDPNNVELVMKVLNADAINGQYWVFYGALSDVQYTLTVTDTQTGRARTYTNPQGTLASRADTAALPTR